jgi:uncharacterized membrane protein
MAQRMPGVEEHVAVFMPCTPNPTTGFFFYLPRSEVIELSISVDEGAKLIMSAGLIQPDTHKKLATPAAEAGPPDPPRAQAS